MSIKISALHLGVFSVGRDQEFVPIEAGGKPRKGEVKVSLNPFLIEQGDRLLLIDSGLGSFYTDDMTPLLLGKIAETGYSERDITDVICSHLHTDHAGGLANKLNGYWDLTFPDAVIWMSGKELETVKKKHHDDMISDFISFIEARGNLNFIENNTEPFAGIRFEVIGGHTRYSLGIFGRDNGTKYLMAGDVLGVRTHVNRKFAANYDYEPKKSQEQRDRLLKFAFENDVLILAYHDTGGPIFRLKHYEDKKGYTIQLHKEHAAI